MQGGNGKVISSRVPEAVGGYTLFQPKEDYAISPNPISSMDTKLLAGTGGQVNFPVYKFITGVGR